MAKKRSYNDDVISISKRALAIVVAAVLLLLGAGAAVFCWGARDSEGHWAKNPTITEWFDYWGKGAPITDEPTTDVKLEKDNPLVVTTTVDNNQPMALTSSDYEVNTLAEATAQANAQNSYTITATVKPAEAFPNAVEWSSDHENDVTVTPFPDDSHKATITCLHPFDNTVTITCTTKYDPKITATAEADYLAQITDVEVHDDDMYKFGEPYTVSVTPFFGTGSITGTATIQGWLIGLNLSDYNAVKEVLGAEFETNDKGGMGNTIPAISSPYDGWGDTSFTRAQFNGAYKNCGPICLCLQVRVEYTYNGKVYATKDAEGLIAFDPSTIPTTDVTGIDFDNNHFIFGQ